jgi:hypothetical protein
MSYPRRMTEAFGENYSGDTHRPCKDVRSGLLDMQYVE